jgi:hypothetical protein
MEYKRSTKMNLAQLLATLPPRVYLRSGELVIHFSTPSDLIARVAETHAAFSELDSARAETRPRGRTNGRTTGTAISEGTTVVETYRTSEGKED